MANDFADLDQKLFGWIHRAVRELVKPTPTANPAAVPLAAMEMRLGLLASGIAERALRIEPTDDLGGATSGALRLPRVMATFDDPESNGLLYVARTALDAMAARHGVERPRDVGDEVARLAAIALVPSLRTAVVAELPAFDALFERLGRRALALRPALPAAASARTRAVDALVRDVLGPGSRPEDDARLRALRTVDPAAGTFLAIELVSDVASLAHGRGEAVEVAFPFAGRLLARPTVAASASTATTPRGGLPGGKQRSARSPDALRRIELPREREGENPLEHSFEKVHTADNYQGGRKALDGDDQLEEHGDALDELDLREVIRTNEVARSVYHLDGSSGLESPEAVEGAPEGGQVFHYDEWDGRAYRPAYCTLVREVPRVDPRARATPPSPEARARHRKVRKVFESLHNARRARGRMPTGSEVDLDAVVERHGFVRARMEGPTRLYVDRPRSEPELATTLLLDLSSSSDAYLRGVRVLDVAREAVASVAEVLDELGAPFSVAGFHSNTRTDCRYLAIKGFEERWPIAARRLGSAEPTGYTRIGPAVRHATHELSALPTRRKAILLLTDGRPTDFDRYEGRYGVTDVKKAVDEASVRGIGFFALAVAETRAPHLAAMFGLGGFEVLTRPEDLVDGLVRAEAFMRR